MLSELSFEAQDHLPGNGDAYSGPGSPASLSSQDNASQTWLMVKLTLAIPQLRSPLPR